MTREELRQYLSPDEAVTWVGAPEPLVMAMRRLPFTLLALAMAGVVMWMFAPSHVIPRLADVWPPARQYGWFYFIGGLGLLFATSPLTAALGASRTLYAVTTRRALVLRGRTLYAFPVDSLPGVSRFKGLGGVADLVFMPPQTGRSGVHVSAFQPVRPLDANGQMHSGSAIPDGFRALRDADAAEQNLQQLLDSRGSGHDEMKSLATGVETTVADGSAVDAAALGKPAMQPGLSGFSVAVLLGLATIYFDFWMLAPIPLILLWRNRLVSGTWRAVAAVVLTLPHVVVAVYRQFLPANVIEVEPSTLATSAHQWAVPYVCFAVAGLLVWIGRGASAVKGGNVASSPLRDRMNRRSARLVFGGMALFLVVFALLYASNLNDDFERVEVMPDGHWHLVHTFRGVVADVLPGQVRSVVDTARVSSIRSANRTYWEVAVTLANGHTYKVYTYSLGARDAVAALNALLGRGANLPAG